MRIEVVVVALSTAAVLVAACGAKTQLPFCGAQTGVACLPSNRDASKTTCFCQAHVTVGCFPAIIFDGNFEGNIPVCLPPAINSGMTSQSVIDNDPNYQTELDQRCGQVDDALQRIASLFFGSPACGGTACISFQHSCVPRKVRVGNGLEPFVTRNATCDKSCTPASCVRGVSCFNPLNRMTGAINPDRCFCNSVTGCMGTSPTLCRPPMGTPDPPPNTTGIVTGLLSEQSTLLVDPSKSLFKLVITQQADGGPVIINQSAAIRGELAAYGMPLQDGSASILLDMRTTIDEMHFKAANQQVDITYVIGTGGAGSAAIQIDKFGDGTIAMGQFGLVLDFTQNGQRSRLETSNAKCTAIHVDYPNKTFHIPSIDFDTSQGLTGSFELFGTITNQGPVARTKPDQVLECTSPAGATATLDGSDSTDADSNVFFASWSRGVGFGNILTSSFSPQTYITSVVSPLGTTTYTFQLLDANFQGGFETTNVTVQDTTPPILTLGTPQPDCLWAPNHKVVLYELGKQLPFVLKDVCDANPKVEIVGVTSNQPDVGGGQGDFSPDFTFGKKGLCLRSERQGTVMWDREYTISVLATDGSNNTNKKTVIVRVPHDQSGASKCPLIDPGRYVDINDSRCTEN